MHVFDNMTCQNRSAAWDIPEQNILVIPEKPSSTTHLIGAEFAQLALFLKRGLHVD